MKIHLKLPGFVTNRVPHSTRPHLDEWVRRGFILAALALTTAAGAAIYQAVAPRSVAPSMAAMLPQGALLTIESPDFAALLQDWKASPQQKSWLASDNYGVFSNSRLFGRLEDARNEFEAVAKVSPDAKAGIDADFLTQVAGRQSIFAWYDVGNLEFLYITRISAGQASNIALLKDRRGWASRQSGGTTFYLRKSSGGPAAAIDQQAQSAQGKARTVAFAQVPDPGGDLLILATREDLIANALTLIHPAPNAPSLATETWYTEASATLPPTGSAPALHMVLNLDRLVPSYYFRSYWVQRNVTAMKQYRAAVSDLYRERGQFREERALLLQSPDDATDSSPELTALAALAPTNGVFQAFATQDADDAVAALGEKLLGRITFAETTEEAAPDPTLEVVQSGSAGDLETRIDAPAPVTAAISDHALAEAVKAANLDAMLTYSTAQLPAAAGLWVPIHSAVVMHGTAGWNPQTLQTALQQSLRANLTTADFGMDFRADTTGGQAIYTLSGLKPLFFAVSGKLCLLSDDRALLATLLAGAARPVPASAPATIVAGFDHSSQRAPFARLTTLVDGTNQSRLVAQTQDPQNHAQPAFFSGNLRSLSDTFAALASERFTERRDGPAIRQTVLYQWQ